MLGASRRVYALNFQPVTMNWRTGRPMVVVGLVPSPCFAEHKVRTYLFMGAAGRCFFYGISIGELPLATSAVTSDYLL